MRWLWGRRDGLGARVGWGGGPGAWLAAVLVLAGAAACDDGAGAHGTPSPPPDVRLELSARSATLPYSRSNTFAVTGSGGVCMLQSYDVEIVCGDRDWRETRVMAREGRGPGEIGPYGTLLTWQEGAVAYRDGANTRVSFFSADLSYGGSVRAPGGLPVMQSTVGGTLHLQNMPARSAVPQLRVRTLDLTTGEERARHLLAMDPGELPRDSVLMQSAVLAPDGGYLAKLRAPGWAGLAWFDAGGALSEWTRLPDYGPVYPSGRDIEAMREDAGLLAEVARRPVLGDFVERYRERPLGFFPRGSAADVLGFDGRGRLWARSTRPIETGSYLEVFEDRKHVGSLEVPGRVDAFQVLDTMLVVLVEGMEPDSVGVYPRRFDWYRIVGTAR